MKFKIAITALILAVASTNVCAQEKFGLGFMIGEPTGLSVKYWLDDERAIDGALAWSFSENDSLQLHGDYLFHDYELLNSYDLPFYYGLGARLKFKDSDGRGRNEDDAIFGLRVPLGITYLVQDEPLELFFEVVPVLDLAPDVELDINAAVGLRFFF
ncbi:MAG: BAPKO_0422 family outer member beta-barrel protein [Planctomycetota bacterium]|jgi:hypothetical protein